jgi:hypothetical protein
MASDLAVALCLRSPLCGKFELVETDALHAVYEVQRRGGRVLRFSFSVEEARKAGLVKPGSAWEKYPARQCIHRAAGFGARTVFPDVILNIYSEAEREEVDVTPAAVSALPKAAAKASRSVPNIVDGEVVEAVEQAAPAKQEAAKPEPARTEPAKPETAKEPDDIRIAKGLNNAKTLEDVKRLAEEAKVLWPKSTSPQLVKDAYATAKKRVSPPPAAQSPAPVGEPTSTPHGAATHEGTQSVLGLGVGGVDRVPGEDDDQ